MNADYGGTKRILHIIHGFGPGGVETWLLATVKYLQAHPELNVRFDFLLTGGKPGLFDQEVRDSGSKLFYVRYSLKSIPRFRRQFRLILKENKYAAIHNHEDFISGWHFMLGGKYLPAIRISHVHNSYKFVQKYVRGPLRWISFTVGRKLMAHWTTKITGTSEAVMNSYGYDRSAFKKKRTYPAYCGIDTSKFVFDIAAKDKICNELGWDPDSKIALFVGRIGLQDPSDTENEKNPQTAFAIAKELVAHSHWNFLFVGYKGEMGERLEQEIKSLSLDNRIKFLGIRRDVPQIMSASDVFIFPSLWEGLGMVAVEAQCSGLKVIMSDTIPSEAIVCPQLVEVKSLNEKAAVWVKAVLDSTLSVEREYYAIQINKSHFSIENSVNRLLSLYEC
jgi:glycosyltransferase involved in cell wall biosynthesis